MSDRKLGFFKKMFSPTPPASEADPKETERGPMSPKPTRPDDGAEPEPKKDKPPPSSKPGPAAPDTLDEPSEKPAEGPDEDKETGPHAPKPKKSSALFQSRPRISESAQPTPESAEPAGRAGWLKRLTGGLSRSSSQLQDSIAAIFTKRKLDETTLEELEDALIRADLGTEEASRIAAAVGQGRYAREISPAEIRSVLADEITRALEPVAKPLRLDAERKPHVALVIGVNGTGKTTTIGKLAHLFVADGHRVVLAAADTFRAAAIDQLKVWGERAGAQVVASQAGADAAGVAFAGLERAQESGADLLLIDTAGRLQNKSNLMAELAKIVRVLRKQDEAAPHSVLLVLDATTGQNGLAQVRAFQEVAGVTGLIMTKLDGTARGGILVRAAAEFGLPVHAIGVGEGMDDLQPFEARAFANALAGA